MRALIADDEPFIRNGIRKRIKWEALGIDEVFTAEDGEEAVRLCMEKQPEIIITDIRMPGIDGLELAEKAAAHYGAKKILIMSGYSEFEYAREAIRIGVVDYMLKPVNLEELSKTIERSVQEIKKEQEKTKWLRKESLLNVLEGKEHPGVLLGNILKKDIAQSGLVCGLLQGDLLYDAPFEEITAEYSETAWSEEYGRKPVFFQLGENRVMLLVSLEDFTARSAYQNLLLSFLQQVNQNCAGSFSMGVSRIGTFGELSRLYQQSESALEHRMHLGRESCVFYEQQNQTEKNSTSFYFDRRAFKEQAALFHVDEVDAYIRQGFMSLREECCTNRDKAFEFCITVKNALIEAVHEKGVDIQSLMERNSEIFEKNVRYDTLDSYEDWCRDYCGLLLKGLTDLSQKRHSIAVAKAVDYINQHFSEEITLTFLAESSCKSTNYFSFIFKKEVGMNFNEYLNEVRIRKAREILETTDRMIYEVAEMVGYHDYKYFTKVFKKICGCSPSEYKEKR